ncbi:hypothetical protein NDU88_007187, partial [Pleurodeles waltl]
RHQQRQHKQRMLGFFHCRSPSALTAAAGVDGAPFSRGDTRTPVLHKPQASG